MRHHGILLRRRAHHRAGGAQDYRVEVRLVEFEVRVTDRSGRADPRSVPRRLHAQGRRRHPRRRRPCSSCRRPNPSGAVGTPRRAAFHRGRRDRAAAHADLDLHRLGSRGHRRAESRSRDSCVPAQRPAARVQGLAGRPGFHRRPRDAAGHTRPAVAQPARLRRRARPGGRRSSPVRRCGQRSRRGAVLPASGGRHGAADGLHLPP